MLGSTCWGPLRKQLPVLLRNLAGDRFSLSIALTKDKLRELLVSLNPEDSQPQDGAGIMGSPEDKCQVTWSSVMLSHWIKPRPN